MSRTGTKWCWVQNIALGPIRLLDVMKPEVSRNRKYLSLNCHLLVYLRVKSPVLIRAYSAGITAYPAHRWIYPCSAPC